MPDASCAGIRFSIVIPTRDRPDALRETLRWVLDQSEPPDTYEVLVVDDGSTPPVVVPQDGRCRVVRLDGRERSAARNAGATAARGRILVFVDDDISVSPQFLSAHLKAHREWPNSLVVGAIVLPDTARSSPFGRFRLALEASGIPSSRGVVGNRNVCTAANMSVARASFLAAGGFDEALTAGEDQDFALRHTERGGRIVFLPEARGIHRDDALDIRTYCRRIQRASESLVAFCRRHPDWPDNRLRDQVNGPIRWKVDSAPMIMTKLVKSVVASAAGVATLAAIVEWLERFAPDTALLDRLYRLLLGAHILRGYRRGILRSR